MMYIVTWATNDRFFSNMSLWYPINDKPAAGEVSIIDTCVFNSTVLMCATWQDKYLRFLDSHWNVSSRMSTSRIDTPIDKYMSIAIGWDCIGTNFCSVQEILQIHLSINDVASSSYTAWFSMIQNHVVRGGFLCISVGRWDFVRRLFGWCGSLQWRGLDKLSVKPPV